MTKSWSVPFPESETEHEGMPVFWRFQATVEEDGIFQLNESLLERITRKLRDGWKRVEVLLCAMK